MGRVPVSAGNVVRFPGLPVEDLEERTLEEMLAGWRNQQLARNLGFATIAARERLVRAFGVSVAEYPWRWSAAMVDEWLGDQRSVRGLKQSTIRAKSLGLRQFCAYLIDPGYGWPEECWARFGTHPVQVCHEWNTAVHVQAADSAPELRPFTMVELQDFFDAADALVVRARLSGRKGWAPAFRDATLFKTAYAWGLRRREVRLLDVADFGSNPHAPEFGRRGVLYVRHGKAMKGSPPKRRSVLSVFEWAGECLDEWVREVRSTLAPERRGVLWPTERNAAVNDSRVNAQFSLVRNEVGLGPGLTFHSLRRSYVTHLIEAGFDPRFVQDQVGHEHASTTAIYTAVSSDFRTRSLRASLDRLAAQISVPDPTGSPS